MEVRKVTSVSTVSKTGKDKECWAGWSIITHIWDTKGTLNADTENNVRKSVVGLLYWPWYQVDSFVCYSKEGVGPLTFSGNQFIQTKLCFNSLNLL